MTDEPTAAPRIRDVLVETTVAVATAFAFLASCTTIDVDPLDRLGQISGLASLAFRFVVCGIALVVALVLARRRGAAAFELATRLGCAVIAGLLGGLLAGGILVALDGTPWGLNGQGGDIGILASRAAGMNRGEPIPPLYPPLSLHILRFYANFRDVTPDLAIKDLQIVGTALFGPVAYVSWRLLLRPTWALAIGAVSVLPLVEPYKPFPNLVLVAFVPLTIVFLGVVRRADALAWKQLATRGAVLGVTFGLMCLMYSGWFQWAAPGLLVATLVVLPWRQGRRKALGLLAITGAAFMVIAGSYLAGLLDPAAKVVDNYVYFDVMSEPMYVAMWRNDTPGIVGVWPPVGELGGVGLFTLILVAGVGLAVALGRKTTVVIALACTMTGAWILRFFYARVMWDTKLVQLYPRTTPLIIYCMMVLTGFALYWLMRDAVRTASDRHSSTLGGTCALLIVLGSAGSALADRYMPLNTTPPGPGWFAFIGHYTYKNIQPDHLRSRPPRWVRRAHQAPGGLAP